MSLIFDRFPSIEQADAFRVAVKERFGLDGKIFATDEEAYEDDVRPWVCVPPIVHIDRVDDDELSIEEAVAAEQRVEVFVEDYGGVFCGT